MTASGAWISISVIRPGGSHWEYEVTDMVNMDQLTAVVEPAEATWTVAPEAVEEAPPAPPPPSPRRSAGAFLRRRWVRVSLAGVVTGALLAVLVSVRDACRFHRPSDQPAATASLEVATMCSTGQAA